MAMKPAPHPVAALIDSVMEVNEWSYRDLGERSSRFGGPARSTISSWRNDEITTVSGDQIRELAKILDVPVQRVIRAYLVSMGLPVDPEPVADVEAAINADGSLSSERRRTLLAVVKALRAA